MTIFENIEGRLAASNAHDADATAAGFASEITYRSRIVQDPARPGPESARDRD
jgi:hypothetical protein